jgi:chemotaxis regulatin CheY-phosphate phosphatase CheZ
MVRDRDAREEEVEAEIGHLKRQAENALRNLSTARSIEESAASAPHSLYTRLNS